MDQLKLQTNPYFNDIAYSRSKTGSIYSKWWKYEIVPCYSSNLFWIWSSKLCKSAR